jgi:two-component system, OmpR family, response regulator
MSPRVLVVDNEPLIRWSLTTGLRLAGFDAVSAADAFEARTLARHHPSPDVVLLDAPLWDADPRQLLEEIREIAPLCRFLVLSVAGREATPPAWKNVAVIRKPFDLHHVAQLVRDELTRAVDQEVSRLLAAGNTRLDTFSQTS